MCYKTRTSSRALDIEPALHALYDVPGLAQIVAVRQGLRNAGNPNSAVTLASQAHPKPEVKLMICAFCQQDVRDPCHNIHEVQKRAENHIDRCENAFKRQAGGTLPLDWPHPRGLQDEHGNDAHNQDAEPGQLHQR